MFQYEQEVRVVSFSEEELDDETPADWPALLLGNLVSTCMGYESIPRLISPLWRR